MNHASIFAQHFSRMVWLLVRQETGFQQEVAFTARAAAAMLRTGGAKLGVENWRLLVDSDPIPEGLSGVPDLTLAAYLVAHSVSAVEFSPFATQTDLVAAATAIGADPVVGDEGKAISLAFSRFGLKSVAVQLGASTTLSDAGDAEAMRQRLMRKGVQSTRTAGSPVPPVQALSMERPATTATDYSRRPAEVAAAPQVESDVFGVLDSSAKAGTLARVLDDLVRKSETAASRRDDRTVFEVMYAIVVRERDATVPHIRTAYLVGVKRLAKRELVRSAARFLSVNREVEDQVLLVFGKLGEAGATLLVEELAEAEQRNERRAIFDIIAKLKAGHEALIHALSDHRWYVVRNAAELLGEIKAEGAAPDLIKVFRHEDERVRRAVAWALGQLNAPSATEPFVGALRDESAKVRALAAAGLGSRKSARSLDVLLERVDAEEDENVQASLLDALGRNGSPSAVKFLLDAAGSGGLLFKRKSSRYRSAAVAALRLVESAEAREMVEKLKADRDPQVRAAAGG